VITFIKDLLKTTRFLIAMALVVAALWLLAAVTLFSAVSAYRSRKHYVKAHLCYQKGDMQKAASELTDIVKSDYGFVEAHNLAGKMALDAKDYENATKHFTNAMNFGGPGAEVQNALAVTRILRDYFPGGAVDGEGKKALRDAASRWPRAGDTFVNIGSVFLYENNPGEALANYKKALATRNVSKEGLAYLYNGMGIIHVMEAKKAGGADRMEALKKAGIEFRKAIAIRPRSPDATANQLITELAIAAARPFTRRGHSPAVSRAERFYDQKRKYVTDPLAYALCHNMGFEAFAEKEYKNAATAFARALKVKPLSAADAFNRAASCVAAAGKEPTPESIVIAREAVESYLTARSATPAETHSLLAGLGNVEYASGDLEVATEYWQRAAKVVDDTISQTDAATVYRALAIVNYEGGRLPKVIEMIKRATDADPSMKDFDKITERLKMPPRVTPPVVLKKEGFPEDMPPIRAEVYNRSTEKPLKKENIKVTIGDVEAIFDFTQHSQLVALPTRPLGEGVHLVQIEATDYLGNTAKAKTSIMIDHTPPAASITPAPDSMLKPGIHMFKITLTDAVSGVDHASIRLLVSRRAPKGSTESYALIHEGAFTKMAGLDRAGVPIEEDEFSFRLNKPLVAGTYILALHAADMKQNKIQDCRWTYSVAEESKK